MELLTVDEVVDLLRISRDTVYRLVAAGKIKNRDAALQALTLQRFIHPAVPGARRHHAHMAGGGEVGQGECSA